MKTLFVIIRSATAFIMETSLQIRNLEAIEIGPLSNGTGSESHLNTQASESHKRHVISGRRKALSQYCACGVLNLLMIIYGTANGFTTVIVAELDELRRKDEDFISLSLLTWMSSLNYIAILIGALFSGLISQSLGRRNTLILSSIPYIASWILIYTCGERQLWPIFLGVVLLGCCGGLIESPTQVYVAETSEPRHRGVIGASTGATCLVGVCLEITVGKYLDWRTLALVSSSLPMLSLICLCFVPESPYWLASKGRHEESLKALAWLRGWSPVSQLPRDEYRAILSSVSKKTDKPLSIKRYFKRSAMVPFALVSFMFLLCCFTGSVTILPWAISLFKEIHSPIHEHYTTIILTVAPIITTTLLMIVVPYTGKRIPTLASLAVSGLALLVVALFIFFAQESAQPNWLSTTAVLMAVASSYFGIRHVPWILLGEVFSTDVRAVMAGILSISDQLLSAIATKTYVYTKQTITLPGTFLFYASVNFIGFVILYFTMPETEGKSLAEIEQYFSGRKVDGNKSVRETSLQDL